MVACIAIRYSQSDRQLSDSIQRESIVSAPMTLGSGMKCITAASMNLVKSPTHAFAVYKKLENSFVVMHCLLKLNGQLKWNLFIAKTAIQVNKEETSDPIDPTQEPPKKARRKLREKKWKEERAKREGEATKLAERFEDILAKKEAKAKRFKPLMEATDKNLKLKERKTMISERKAALE
ncbi:Disease resistance protein RPM1 [Hordeum vulgare]|nr:Disease resistance protein RPM1 [Hordeum vulgare]